VGAGGDGAAEDHPGDGGAYKDGDDGKDAKYHEARMTQPKLLVKYFLI